MTAKMTERRRYIRIEVPLEVEIKANAGSCRAITRNISPIGLKMECERSFNIGDHLAVTLELPSSDLNVNMDIRVVWQKRVSLEDNSPFEMGVEIIKLEENMKNILLKYLCDLLYDSAYHSN